MDDSDDSFYENTAGIVHIFDVAIRTNTICLALSAAMILFTLPFVVGRLYVRIRILKHFFIDDWLISAAMTSGLCAFVAWAVTITALNYSMKLEMISELEPEQVQASEFYEKSYKSAKTAIMSLGVSIIFSMLQATLARLSILYTFSRLSASSNRMTLIIRRSIHCVALFIIVIAVPSIWLSVDPCWPPHMMTYYGTGLDPEDVCLSPGGHMGLTIYMFLITSCVSAAIDLFAFALPFLIFRWAHLGMTDEERQGLHALFAFGLIVFLTSIVRVVYMGWVITQGATMSSGESQTIPMALGLLEASCVTMGAALPVIAKPLLLPIWRRVKATFVKKRKGEAASVSLCLVDLDNGANNIAV